MLTWMVFAEPVTYSKFSKSFSKYTSDLVNTQGILVI